MNTIFALDASGKTAGVCVLSGEEILFEQTLNQGLTHSETLLPLVQKAFESTKLTPAAINLYAVSVGPGSFTGLRIALSLVKGLALPFALPVAPVSTLHAAALGSGLEGIVVSALDARRGEVYWAAFDCRSGCTRLLPDTASPVADLANHLNFSGDSIFFVGDGAELCYNTYNYGCVARQPDRSGPISIVRGVALEAKKIAEQGNICSAAAVRPTYLRLSQAERERAEREAKTAASHLK